MHTDETMVLPQGDAYFRELSEVPAMSWPALVMFLLAFATGIVYNLWLYRRKHIGSLILAHAVTNASLFAVVVWASEDLWFFL